MAVFKIAPKDDGFFYFIPESVLSFAYRVTPSPFIQVNCIHGSFTTEAVSPDDVSNASDNVHEALSAIYGAVNIAKIHAIGRSERDSSIILVNLRYLLQVTWAEATVGLDYGRYADSLEFDSGFRAKSVYGYVCGLLSNKMCKHVNSFEGERTYDRSITVNLSRMTSIGFDADTEILEGLGDVDDAIVLDTQTLKGLADTLSDEFVQAWGD